ncbi:MAG TPA: PAS domain-containing protein [Candidatus Binatia bacterium]|nr:PAS domain-containing protein [Candidatus Binatia bacterium]
MPIRADFRTPGGVGDAVMRRRREQDLIDLRRRARIGVVLVLLVLFGLAAVVDPAIHPDVLWQLYSVKIVLVAVGVWLWRLTDTSSQRRLICAMVAAAITMAAVIAVSSLLVHEDWSAAILCGLLMTSVAGLVPWGRKAQLIAASGIVLFGAIPGMVYGSADKAVFLPTILVVMLFTSALIAFEHERHRRESWHSLMFFRENMERLRQVAEHINGVLWLNEVGDWGESFLYVSPRYDAVWARDRGELQDRPDAWLDALHPDDRPAVEARFRAGIARGDFDCEYRLVHPDGGTRWIHDYVFPIRDVEGRTKRVARLSQDVTAEKEFAAAARMRELARSIQAAREEERRRIARELHDELGQALTGIKLRLVGLIWSPDTSRDDATGTMRTCVREIEEAMKSVHGMIHRLHPPILDDLGLLAALRVQADSFVSRTGIRCELDVPEIEPELSPEEVTAVFRIAQESLTNVARHAHATEVVVRLSTGDDSVELSVADDGRGIGDAKESFGLRGMGERAALLNGTLRVGSLPERGTIVRLAIPRHAGGGWT